METCAICGNPLPDKRVHNRKYCSPECYMKSRALRARKAYKPVPPAEIICAVCGKKFMFSRGGAKYYCSPECRNVAKQKLSKKRHAADRKLLKDLPVAVKNLQEENKLLRCRIHWLCNNMSNGSISVGMSAEQILEKVEQAVA